MKKWMLPFLAFMVAVSLAACGAGNEKKERVVIYSSMEDFRTEHVSVRLAEQFPQYDISIQYLPTGNNAAKIKAEGRDTECDIVLGLECIYLEMLQGVLADLSGYSADPYVDELVPAHRRYLPWERASGAIIVSPSVLEAKGLPVPASYEDLLNPIYKGLISMPNPKTSSGGYMFLKNLVNAWGEDEAFAYFDKLSENVLQFTSSGSGPVNALVQGEAAVGLGLTFTAVNAINNGADLDLYYFSEGAPYSSCGIAIIDGRQEKQAVKDVFDFLYSDLCLEDKQLYVPEAIYKDQTIEVPNFPTDIPYGDMTGWRNSEEKNRLLEKWKY